MMVGLGGLFVGRWWGSAPFGHVWGKVADRAAAWSPSEMVAASWGARLM